MAQFLDQQGHFLNEQTPALIITQYKKKDDSKVEPHSGVQIIYFCDDQQFVFLIKIYLLYYVQWVEKTMLIQPRLQ